MHLYPVLHMYGTLNPYAGKYYRACWIDVTTRTLGSSNAKALKSGVCFFLVSLLLFISLDCL